MMKTILATSILLAVSGFFGKDKLTGRWESQPSPKGNVTSVVFKEDGSFDGFVNKKPFVTGQYALEDNIFSFVDNGCNGAKGVYKIIFFSNEDSLRFEPITDTCGERKEGMIRLIVGRIKKH